MVSQTARVELSITLQATLLLQQFPTSCSTRNGNRWFTEI